MLNVDTHVLLYAVTGALKRIGMSEIAKQVDTLSLVPAGPLGEARSGK